MIQAQIELYDSYNKIGEGITHKNEMKFRDMKVFHVSGYMNETYHSQTAGSRGHWTEKSRNK